MLTAIDARNHARNRSVTMLQQELDLCVAALERLGWLQLRNFELVGHPITIENFLVDPSDNTSTLLALS